MQSKIIVTLCLIAFAHGIRSDESLKQKLRAPSAPCSEYEPTTWDKYYPNPDDSHSFWHCAPYGYRLLQCPSPQVFNSKNNLCVDPVDAKPAVVVEGILCSPADPSTLGKKYPNPENEGSYWECGSDGLKLIRCEEGLYFDTEINDCDIL